MSSFNINKENESNFESLMEYVSLEFHTDVLPVSIFTESDTKFGIFTLKPFPCEPSAIPIVIQCTIDISTSMEEYVEWSKTYQKIDFIKQTLEKMLTYLLDNFNIEIWIQIGVFNSLYMTLIPMQMIQRENIKDIIEKINSITCDGSTNIEVAFIESRNIMETSIKLHPTYKHVHIFLTDGNATDGIEDNMELSQLISTQYPTLFIGYGYNHNADLLKTCANHLSHSYQYVDNFEMTGKVYAEILYSLIYNVMEKTVIEIEDGYIYDSLHDEWTNRIEIPLWVAEKEYIYHISSANPDDTILRIYKDGELLFTEYKVPLLEDTETNELEVRNFDKYIFKQKTMELLSMALHIQISTDEIDTTNKLIDTQKKLADLFILLRTYMREKNLLEDSFLKILCEDLSISYQTIKSQLNYDTYDTNYVTMNILSRRNAQATQGIYRSGSAVRRNAQNSQPYTPQLSLHRSISAAYYDEDCDVETQIDDWSITDCQDNEDSIENYCEEFVTQNIYSPSGMDRMARHISS